MPGAKSSVGQALDKVLQACAWVGQTVTWVWRAAFPGPPMRMYQARFQCEAPCKGDAFSFRVTIHEFWTFPGRSDVMDLALKEHIEAQHMEVVRRLRGISRNFSPEETEKFECEANTKIGSLGSRESELRYTCRYSVEVAPDGKLHEQLQKAEVERLEARAGEVLKEQNLHHLEVMHGRWFAFLRKFDDDELGSLAAQLAGAPDKFPQVIAERMEERERVTDELRKLCDTTSDAYRDKGVFDFVTSTESAINRLLRHVGANSASKSDGKPGSGESGTGNGDTSSHV
ncbi:MAG TPA: hypothetical protein VGS19_30355 [Streptosporangiaceae bacterium]|nr:hypothetical protein [Streptosporangiaceae bacterium]